MATKLGVYAKGASRLMFPEPKQTGQVACEITTHVFTEDVLTTDVLELFPLLPFGRIVGFEFISANLGAITLDFAEMTGDFASVDPARAMGTGAKLLMSVAAAAGAVATLAQIAAFNKNGDTARGIGLKPSANITLGATKTITYRVFYEL